MPKRNEVSKKKQRKSVVWLLALSFILVGCSAEREKVNVREKVAVSEQETEKTAENEAVTEQKEEKSADNEAATVQKQEADKQAKSEQQPELTVLEQKPKFSVTVTEKGEIAELREFSDKTEFLTAYGFGEAEPYYTYYDSDGTKQLELYLNEKGRGCGIRYIKEPAANENDMAGFAFDIFGETEWMEGNPYILESVNGETGAEEVLDYTETYEYNENEQLTFYQSTGKIEWMTDEDTKPEEIEPEVILELSFVYREDGTLCRRSYFHNPSVFGTTYSSQESYYDAQERLIYKEAYITHGHLEYYYIYEGDSKVPLYCLELDDNLDAWVPTIAEYQGEN